MPMDSKFEIGGVCAKRRCQLDEKPRASSTDVELIVLQVCNAGKEESFDIAI